MKKIISTLAILFLITSFGYAQRKYSREYLAQLSKTELESSLLEAKKLERNGTIVAIIGGSAVVVGTGIAVYSHNHGTMDQAYFGSLFYSGLAAGLTGILMYATGISRVNKIRLAQLSSGLTFETSPSIIKVNELQTSCPGVAVRLKF